MSSNSTDQLTAVINALQRGEAKASSELLPLVYEHLRRLARARMAHVPPGNTLQATALVHEAYLRLAKGQGQQWSGRGHFFAAAAEAMRRILIEHARKRGRIKRGGDLDRVPLSAVYLAENAHPEEIMSVDTAIRRLEGRDSRMATIVRLRFFAGLSTEEIAETLGLSDRTVRREWALARAWLHKELGEGR